MAWRHEVAQLLLLSQGAVQTPTAQGHGIRPKHADDFLLPLRQLGYGVIPQCGAASATDSRGHTTWEAHGKRCAAAAGSLGAGAQLVPVGGGNHLQFENKYDMGVGGLQ